MPLPLLGGILLRYGLPLLGTIFGSKIGANAQRSGDRETAEYNQRALDAALEEQRYRRSFDEDARNYDRRTSEEDRDYSRRTSEEDRSYGRYSDTYGRASNEEDRAYGRAGDTYGRASSEEDRAYGRAGDTYGRASDEERLWYDRAQSIRDKNYGYQQYGNFVETLEPFRAGGGAAASRMSQMMGGPATPNTGSYLNLAQTARDSVQSVPSVPDRPEWSYSGTRPTFDYQGTRPTWDYAGSSTSSTSSTPTLPPPTLPPPQGGEHLPTNPGNWSEGGPSGETVRMQISPTMVKDVPRENVAQWQARGAQVVA